MTLRSKQVPTTTLSEEKDAKMLPRTAGRSVKFCNIEIRKYWFELSDNPSVTSGPPIGIGWKYSPQTVKITVEEFEEVRPKRRCRDELKMKSRTRERLLLRCGYSHEDIEKATKEAKKYYTMRSFSKSIAALEASVLNCQLSFVQDASKKNAIDEENREDDVSPPNKNQRNSSTSPSAKGPNSPRRDRPESFRLSKKSLSQESVLNSKLKSEKPKNIFASKAKIDLQNDSKVIMNRAA